jgi:hypothetical protein
MKSKSGFWTPMLYAAIGYFTVTFAVLAALFAIAMITGYLDSFQGLLIVSFIALPMATWHAGANAAIVLVWLVLCTWFVGTRRAKTAKLAILQISASLAVYSGLVMLCSITGNPLNLPDAILIGLWLSANHIAAQFAPKYLSRLASRWAETKDAT